MAASGVQLNWTSVSFNSTSITRVTSCSFDQGGELIEFSGDNARYPQIIANNVSRPRASVTSADAAVLFGFATGQSGTLNATHADALAAVNGAVVFAMSNAVHESSQESGSWGQFGQATATFRAFASDGATNPLSITRA